ncbi:hypothetical protein ACWD4N_45435, partial [Streptomyces sp. NPDC002586]
MASMPIPQPFDLGKLVANIEAARGRRIVMKPLPDHLAGLTGLHGLLVHLDDEPLDVIYHVTSPSPWHQRKIKLHELIHLWARDTMGAIEIGSGRTLSSGDIGDLISTRHAEDRRRYDTRVEERTEDAAALINELAGGTDFITDPTARCLA